MKLQIGERLSGSGPPNQPGGYLVTEVISDTPWSGLYAAKKVYYNFDFTGKRPRETDVKEWLDVLLRTIHYPQLDSAEYVAGRRALARAECQAVLGNRTSNLWPEPLDLLELVNTRDPFTYGRDASGARARSALGASDLLAREPVLVLARPHGEPVTRWLHSNPPLALVLSVVAELLEFIADAHADGLLLNGLGPSGLLVDRAGRMYYLGTDMVVQFDGTAGAAADWKRFFPPERYPRGYSAPECFDPAAPRDRRTDLYAWAAIAYFLLTGDRPVQLAFEQGQPWTRFGPDQFARLEKALAAIPATQIEHWAGQLRVDPADLRRDWPRLFVSALQCVLNPDPRRRPNSAAELRAWLTAPPPSPPAAVLALRLPRSDALRIFYRLAEPDLEVVIRRDLGTSPEAPEQGVAVHDGPPTPFAEDTAPRTPCPTGSDEDLTNPAADAVRYAVFSRRRYGSSATCSVPTPAHLIDPFPPSLRRLAEGKTQPGAADEPEPPVIGLLFQALDTTRAAEALLASPLPQVRGWALRRAAAVRGKPGASGSVEVLLLRALHDPLQTLRLEVVRGLLGGPEPPSENLLRRVFEALAAAHPEDCVAAARLAQERVPEAQLGPTLAALKLDIPTTCPVCAARLADRDTPGHLIRAHGHVEIAGELLPREEALARLWERVFQAGDTASHDRLHELLREGSANGPPAADAPLSAYVIALGAELCRRATDLFDDPPALARLLACLRQTRAARPHFPGLLRNDDARVRELGRELLLPDLADGLAEEALSAADLRRRLDEVCPDALIEEKLLLCTRLAPLGVSSEAVEECVRQLQGERPVVCSECGARVRQAEYDAHLHRVHRVYEFRGVRRTLQQTLNTLLEALCGSSPDFEAWTALEAIAREEQGEKADTMLASWVTRRVSGLPEGERGQVAAAVAEAVVAGGSGPRLLPLLASPRMLVPLQPAAWLLALEVTARLPAPLPSDLIRAVKPLLADRRLPRPARETAVAALLRTTGKAGPPALAVLAAYVDHVPKPRAIDLLRELEQHLGQAEAIDELCAQLEDQIRLSCPRCQIELTRLDMIGHLWDRHRLMLDGRRVREPWRVLQDWVEDYRLEKDPDVLKRCRTLVGRLDPAEGEAKLGRLLLQRGVEDADALGGLLEQARARNVSLCPHCYALVPLPEFPPPPELYFGKLGLSGSGYRVEVRDGLLAPWLEVKTPEGRVYRGREPSSRRTRLGALFVLLFPLLMVVPLLALLPSFGGLPRWLPAAVVGGLGLLVAAGIWRFWPKPGDLQARVLHHAWTVLVPYLRRKGFPGESLTVVAGLAELSAGRGDAKIRAKALAAARTAVEQAARANSALGTCAGSLARLAIEDPAWQGEDAVPALAAELLRCVQGELPLGYAAGLLRARENSDWTRDERQRLRVRLCEEAHAAGLGLHELLTAGRACAILGALLDIGNEGALAEFFPESSNALVARSPEAVVRLAARNAVACPECGKPLLPCAGEVGVAAEASPAQATAAQPA
jgi:hypothetical protein